MTTSNWIKITPPPAPAEPYDGKWYWVHFLKVPSPVVVMYTNRRKWVNQKGQEYDEYMPLAYQPYIEPEPYVESES
jgi:hypothetical protein